MHLCRSGGLGLCCCAVLRCCSVLEALAGWRSWGRCSCCTAVDVLLSHDVEAASCDDTAAAGRAEFSATVWLRASVKPCAAISSLVSSSMVLSNCSSEQWTCGCQKVEGTAGMALKLM